jgi:hypothetical protein
MAFPTLILVALLDLRKKRPEAENSENSVETRAGEGPRMLSTFRTWRTDPDGGNQSIRSDEPESPTQKRAA